MNASSLRRCLLQLPRPWLVRRLNYLLGILRWEELSVAAQYLYCKHFLDFPVPSPEVLRNGDYLVRVRDRWIGERVARSELPAHVNRCVMWCGLLNARVIR